MILKLIGDTHGDYTVLLKEYAKKDFDLMLSVGDLGLDYTTVKRHLDPDFFKVVGGNHDNYDTLVELPHYLGNYGLVPGTSGRAFFVRGANSTDKEFGVPGINWWPEEQLNMLQCEACLGEWERVGESVSLLVTHTCSRDYTALLIPDENPLHPCNTSHLISQMYRVHPPPTHVFGHFHTSWKKRVSTVPEYGGRPKPTEMICLNSNETLKISLG